MRIMIFAAGGDIGGGKTHILSLARELSADNELVLLSFRKGVLADEAREMGLSTIDMSNGWHVGKDLRMALEAVDKFRPDVIHCHGAKANMMGVMVKWRRRIPVMTTVHSDPKLDYMGMPLKQYTFGVINAIALRNMDFYMAVADRMERNLIERGFDPHRIFTIYNGLDFSKASEEPRPMKGDGDDIVVGIAARLTPIKDIGTVIRAFAKAHAKNPRLRLSIAGTGEDESELRQLAEDLNVAERVTFEGWISDIQKYFSKVDINVLASLSETFPYSLLEGAYEHCPAIASRVGGIPSLISHGESGFLFEPGDVDTFADYIYRLSVDRELRQLLAENLFRKAKNEFSLKRMKEDQQKVYATIMRRKTQKGRRGAVICGAYGRGNAGDEAILKAILKQLREIDEDMPFWVMSRNPEETKVANRANSFYIFNVFALFKRLRQAKIFVNGGGSLIQDVTSSRSLYFYLFTLQAAKWCGCHIIMYGCGIGPLSRPRNRRLAGKVLNRTAEIITLRDSVSMELLADIGVEKPEIILAADPTLNIGMSGPLVVEEAFRMEGIPADVKKIGFCLRNWSEFRSPESVACAAEYAWRKYGLTPVFLPIEIPKDIDTGKRVAALLKDTPYYCCEKRHQASELIGMLSSMDVVVGMRLHALIFSTAGGTPVVGVSYDVKVDSFIKDIDSEACVPLSELSGETLCREIDRVLTLGRERSEEISARLQGMERRNGEAARRLLS